MLIVNNKNTRMNVSLVDFEQVNARWDNIFSYDDLEISLLYVYKKSNFKRTKM